MLKESKEKVIQNFVTDITNEGLEVFNKYPPYKRELIIKMIDSLREDIIFEREKAEKTEKETIDTIYCYIHDNRYKDIGVRLHGYTMDTRIKESVFAEDEDELDYELYL